MNWLPGRKLKSRTAQERPAGGRVDSPRRLHQVETIVYDRKRTRVKPSSVSGRRALVSDSGHMILNVLLDSDIRSEAPEGGNNAHNRSPGFPANRCHVLPLMELARR